jgi:hypothetical protein
MKISKKWFFWIGIGLLILLPVSYFIKFKIESGADYILYDSLLGIIIFHNPFILGLYALIVISFIVAGLKNSFIRFK